MKTVILFIDQQSQQVDKRLLWMVDGVLVFITFLEGLGFWVQLFAGIAAAFLSICGGLSYLSKRKVNKLDAEIKQQQLYDIIETNKKKHG